MEHIAWTGGTSPRSFHEVSEAEYQYVLELFWNDCNLWRDYWKGELTSEVLDTFWGRARYDAHATFRVENHKSVLASGSRFGENSS